MHTRESTYVCQPDDGNEEGFFFPEIFAAFSEIF